MEKVRSGKMEDVSNDDAENPRLKIPERATNSPDEKQRNNNFPGGGEELRRHEMKECLAVKIQRTE